MTADTTLIRVPTAVRERLRVAAARSHETFGAVIDRGLDLIERELFWDRVAALSPDSAYRAEFAAWDADDTDSEAVSNRPDHALARA